MEFQTADNQYRKHPLVVPEVPTFLASVCILHGSVITNPPSEEIDETITVVPYCNEARWVVECPNDATHAILACVDPPLFFCPYDLNVWNQGRAIRIIWPDNVEEVERILSWRPSPVNMNYYPESEIPGLLLAENKVYMPWSEE